MRRLILLTTMLASGGAGAITMNFSHPYGELVDRGSVTIRVDVTTAWDCTSATVVDLATKRLTLTGGLSPPARAGQQRGLPDPCLALQRHGRSSAGDGCKKGVGRAADRVRTNAGRRMGHEGSD